MAVLWGLRCPLQKSRQTSFSLCFRLLGFREPWPPQGAQGRGESRAGQGWALRGSNEEAWWPLFLCKPVPSARFSSLWMLAGRHVALASPATDLAAWRATWQGISLGGGVGAVRESNH